MWNKILLRIKLFNRKYIIKKNNGKYFVATGWGWFREGVDKLNVDDTWFIDNEYFILKYCAVDSCKEAYDIIKKCKQRDKKLKKSNKIAWDCYDN